MSRFRIVSAPGRLAAARSSVVLLIALGASLVVAAAPDSVVSSVWRTHPIQIDGHLDDWKVLASLPKGPAVAAANDDQFLYLAVVTSDPKLRRSLGRGLVLWFDSTGKRKADRGFELPGVMGPGFGRSAGDPPPEGADSGPARADHIDILGPGKERRLVELSDAGGIQVASGLDQDRIVFEVKLPLATSPTRPYAAGVAPGHAIDLGVFSPELPKPGRAGREGFGDEGRRRGGISGGMGGGPMGGGFGGYGGMGGDDTEAARPSQVKLWTTLDLAAAH